MTSHRQSRSLPFALLGAAFAVVLLPTALHRPSLFGTAQASDSPAFADYLTRIALADRFEIRASRLALDRAGSPAVRAFASAMLRDQTERRAVLMQAASHDDLDLPLDLDPLRRRQLERLRATRGAEFDRLYRDTQLASHREALELHRIFAETGTDAGLRQWAGAWVPSTTARLTRLETSLAPPARLVSANP
jgi:putative membrane protein